MSYREHAPPPALAPWLACTWERHALDGVPTRVLPDGCIDVIWIEGVGTQLVGANTTAFLISLPPGARVVGARMRPGAAPALLGVSGESVRDLRAPVQAVLDSRRARLAAALDGHRDPLVCLLATLGQWAAEATTPDPIVREAVTRLTRPETRVAALADELGLSERHLRRRVSCAVGYGPKRLARVLRLRRALDAARAGDDLARVAVDAGYADQAHFTNDCRELAGLPPSLVIDPRSSSP
jgi:AraC-like DNA-binding protein